MNNILTNSLNQTKKRFVCPKNKGGKANSQKSMEDVGKLDRDHEQTLTGKLVELLLQYPPCQAVDIFYSSQTDHTL